MIKRITAVQTVRGPGFRVELTASGILALTQAKLALAALMPGLRMDDSASNAINVLPITLYRPNGGEEWRGLSAEALNARLKSAAHSFVMTVRSRRRTVEMVLNYNPSASHVANLLVGYLSELPEVKTGSVTIKEATVTLKVALLTNLPEFEKKLRQRMRFSLR